VALSRSPHPEATKLLLSLWQDPYYAVRIDVLHALGKMDSAESLELLRKMSTDTNETVRNEALRYLKLRMEKPKASEAGKPPDR
jgi:HEAT repeat protein